VKDGQLVARFVMIWAGPVFDAVRSILPSRVILTTWFGAPA